MNPTYFMFDPGAGRFYVSTHAIAGHHMLRSYESYEAPMALELLALCERNPETKSGLLAEVDTLLGLDEPCPACPDLHEIETPILTAAERRAATIVAFRY